MARMFDVAGKPVRVLEGHTDDVTAIAVFQDAKHVCTGSFDKTARMFDTTTGKQLRKDKEFAKDKDLQANSQ